MNPATNLYIPGYRVYVPHSSILYLRSDCNYTYVFCVGVTYFCATTLKKMVAQCPSFIRLNRSEAFNPCWIKAIEADSVTLKGGKTLLVSRRRRPILKTLSVCLP